MVPVKFQFAEKRPLAQNEDSNGIFFSVRISFTLAGSASFRNYSKKHPQEGGRLFPFRFHDPYLAWTLYRVFVRNDRTARQTKEKAGGLEAG